jgi:hypothetical protein
MDAKDLPVEHGNLSFNPNQSGRQRLQCEGHRSRESRLIGALSILSTIRSSSATLRMPCATTIPNSAKWPSKAFTSAFRCEINNSRALCSIKLGKRLMATIHHLGYPTKNALKRWHCEYTNNASTCLWAVQSGSPSLHRLRRRWRLSTTALMVAAFLQR